MTFLASFSNEARDELREFVEQVVIDVLARRDRAAAEREWVDTDDAAAMLSTTPNAVRCRIRRGWLRGDVVRDGKRLLISRAAILEDLENRQRAGSSVGGRIN